MKIITADLLKVGHVITARIDSTGQRHRLSEPRKVVGIMAEHSLGRRAVYVNTTTLTGRSPGGRTYFLTEKIEVKR